MTPSPVATPNDGVLVEHKPFYRKVSFWLEISAIAIVLACVRGLWPYTPVPAGLEVASPPWWGSFRDLLIEGPDAGHWAQNIERMAAADYAHLDPHRMPTWLVLTGALVRLGHGIVESAHLVNRALYVVAGLGTYFLGRLCGGRTVGIVAAALALAHPQFQLATQRFGIDAAVEATLPLALALGFATASRWWFGTVAGFFVAWIAFFHHTALPYALPPLLAALCVGQPGWRRFAGVGTMLVGGAGAVALIARIFPVASLAKLATVVEEGARPGSTGGGTNVGPGVVETVQANLVASLPKAKAALSEQMMHWHVPDAWLYALIVLGVLGPFLASSFAHSRVGGMQVSRSLGRELLRNVVVGVVILACLAPLPVLAAVDAPPRYGNNLLPFVAVLVARGGASLAMAADRLIRAIGPRWPLGLLTAIIGLGAARMTVRQPWMDAYPNNNVDEDIVGFYLLGESLRETFPAGAKVDCPVSEALFQAGLQKCNELRCPLTSDEPAITACLRTIATRCATDGHIGYVALPGRQMYDPALGGRTAADEWVATRYAVSEWIVFGRFSAFIYRIPVSEIPAAEGAPPPPR